MISILLKLVCGQCSCFQANTPRGTSLPPHIPSVPPSTLYTFVNISKYAGKHSAWARQAGTSTENCYSNLNTRGYILRIWANQAFSFNDILLLAECQMIYPGKFPPKEIKWGGKVNCDNFASSSTTPRCSKHNNGQRKGVEVIEHFWLCTLWKKWERKEARVGDEDPPRTRPVIKAFFSSPGSIFSLFWDPSMATKPICDLSQVGFGIDASAEDQRLRHRKRWKLGAWDARLPPPP